MAALRITQVNFVRLIFVYSIEYVNISRFTKYSILIHLHYDVCACLCRWTSMSQCPCFKGWWNMSTTLTFWPRPLGRPPLSRSCPTSLRLYCPHTLTPSIGWPSHLTLYWERPLSVTGGQRRGGGHSWNRYHIAWIFWGRKLSWISLFGGYQRKFSPRKMTATLTDN